MVKVVVVNGRPGVGKTTFEELCNDKAESLRFLGKRNIYIEVISTVDFVKEVATFCGWDGVKTLKSRKFLSDLKDLLAEWNDVPFKKIEEKVYELAEEKEENHILFVDSREPKEIERFKQTFQATTLLIRRPGDEDIETSNHADAGVFDYNYDYTVQNDGDLRNLRYEVVKFFKYIEGVNPYEFCN